MSCLSEVELRGKTIGEVWDLTKSQRILSKDCYFCGERKKCKNPNSKRKDSQLTQDSIFYTCAAYTFNPKPTIKKPEKAEPFFNPERISILNWALKVAAK